MNDIYKAEKLLQSNFFQRLFKKEPKENAFLEVNNLFSSRPLKEIKYEDIVAISKKYRVDLRKQFIERLKELYLLYLKQCLADNILDAQELDDLDKLKSLLMLKDSEIEELNNRLASEIFKILYDGSISDGKVEDSERELYRKLQQDLRLPENIIENISAECRKQYFENKLHKFIKDAKISPDEWDEYTSAAKNLNVNLKMDETLTAQIEKLKLYWLIENGELPIREVSINLQKNERCYFTSFADWFESRTVTDRINYHGPTARVNIMKGFYYRVGSIAVKRITSEKLLLIDAGQVYITNKRIIYDGKKKNTSILLTKILSVYPYSDGVGIEKDNGRSPIIRVSDNADILATILCRVIKDLQI